MINKTRSRQNWEIGSLVKVGFMRLQVVAAIPTPGDYKPDKYWLVDPRNNKPYTFTPHNGIESGHVTE